MSFKKKTSGKAWYKVQQELDYLKHHQLIIGFFGAKNSQLLTIVGANEYGAIIKPKNGQSLAIPTKDAPKAHGGGYMTASQYTKQYGDDSLFRPKGKNVLCKKDKDGKLTVLYILVKQTKIPARPFIRKAAEGNEKKYKAMIEQGVNDIIFHDMTAKRLLNRLGSQAANDIRKSAATLKTPKNAPLTIENKGSSNPLVGAGFGGNTMISHVTYEIMRI